MVIQHNLLTENAFRQMKINTSGKQKAMEKLSTGYSINRAGDNAAELAISTKMRAQIRGLDQADQNIQNGVSLLQTADGAMDEINELLKRMGELSVQSANDTNTDDDRANLNKEFKALKKEINRISSQTEFNTKKLLFDDTVSVGGVPNDIEVYTGDSGDYAGIVYRNVRYGWSDFKSETGGSSLDVAVPKTGDYSLLTTDGTKLHFSMDEGKDIPYISKKYDLAANSTSIRIDDYSYNWGSVEDEDGFPIDTANPKEGIYSLEHQGSIIEFYVDEGDTQDDIIKKLNASSEGTASSWESNINEIQYHPAAYYLDPTASTIDITNTNKDNINNSNYIIHADDTGIHINNNSTVAWSDLTYSVDNTAGTKTGVDFDNGDGINHNTTVFFECPDSGISFSFRISSESNMDEVIGGLNNVTIPATVNAPVQGQITLGTSGSSVMTGASIPAGGLNISYATQRDVLGLDFNNTPVSVKSVMDISDPPLSPTIPGRFQLDNTELGKLSDFYANGLSNTVQLTFRNSLSESITVDFTCANNTTANRAGDPAGYANARMADFQAQFNGPDTTASITSVNAYLQVGSFDENNPYTAGSANRTDAMVFGVKPKVTEPIHIQAGANSSQDIPMSIDKIGAAILGIGRKGIENKNSAEDNIKTIQDAMDIVSKSRSKIGAYENTLEHTQNYVSNTAENMQKAESVLRDTDMAKEMVKYSKMNILEQASQSMIVQSNQTAQGVLTLLK
jgi:flagellin-like hook-associated protein FlgL